MAISSNSLFHYTSDIATLKKIIKNGFQVSICMESVMAIPMVSFCDLPLSYAKYFLNNYGSYALGMKTDWGIRNGLNPVLYLEEESNLRNNLVMAMNSLENVRSNIKEEDKELNEDFLKVQNYIIETTRYEKPYKGTLIRGESIIENYKFYDEREWRYIPDIGNDYFPMGLSEEEYSDFKKKHPKKPHFKKHGLQFKAKDIKYIILKEEAEIPKLITFLMNTTNLGSARSIQLLFPKILLAEQIIEDI